MVVGGAVAVCVQGPVCVGGGGEGGGQCVPKAPGGAGGAAVAAAPVDTKLETEQRPAAQPTKAKP